MFITMHGFLNNDLNYSEIFIHQHIDILGKTIIKYFPPNNIIDNYIFSKYYLYEITIDYNMQRIVFLKNVINIIDSCEELIQIMYNNHIYSYLVYDLYRCINNENEIEHVFSKASVTYMLTVNVIDQSDNIEPLFKLFNFDNELSEYYLSIINKITKPKLSIIMLNDINLEKYYFLIMKKILNIQNIPFIIYEKNKIINDFTFN